MKYEKTLIHFETDGQKVVDVSIEATGMTFVAGIMTLIEASAKKQGQKVGL